jgi:flagellar biosynthesis/type III secretory pathway protein FliH
VVTSATPATSASEALTTPAVEPEAVNFWETDAGREIQADRVRIEDVLGQLGEKIGSLDTNQTARLEQWQRAAVELAMTIATRLLHERIVSGDFPMEAKVRDMIAQLHEDGPVAVYLNPADLDLLRSRRGDQPIATGRDEPRLMTDAALRRGECRVEARDSILLSDITRELQEIRDELLRSLSDARP